MRQTELKLSSDDRERVEEWRGKGLRPAREVNRAHILSALDGKVPESVICQVLGVGRTAIWRTRAAYLEGGLEHAVEAEISALASSKPPTGFKRWTLVLLEREARTRPGMQELSRETIRRLLKKMPRAVARSDVVCGRIDGAVPPTHA